MLNYNADINNEEPILDQSKCEMECFVNDPLRNHRTCIPVYLYHLHYGHSLLLKESYVSNVF